VLKNVFSTFRGLDHRTQLVATVNDVSFVDDSKSTTIDSTRAALAGIKGNVVLIAGGRNKGVDFSKAAQMLKDKVRVLILIGEAASEIHSAVSDFPHIETAKNMEEAVRIAKEVAVAGDTVLLSPMCASFDMFKDYKHRGEVFKTSVEKL